MSVRLYVIAKPSHFIEDKVERSFSPDKRATGLGQTGCKGTRVER
jgi:hypothetical protein